MAWWSLNAENRLILSGVYATQFKGSMVPGYRAKRPPWVTMSTTDRLIASPSDRHSTDILQTSLPFQKQGEDEPLITSNGVNNAKAQDDLSTLHTFFIHPTVTTISIAPIDPNIPASNTGRARKHRALNEFNPLPCLSSTYITHLPFNRPSPSPDPIQTPCNSPRLPQ